MYILLVFFFGCKDGIKDPGLAFKPNDVVSGESNRSSWQKPQEVINLLGDMQDMTIADVGAGTGYFTFRMAFKAKKVLALDIDPTMISLMETFRANLPQDIHDKIEIRKVDEDDPKLSSEEVDAAIIINTITYISDKEAYLTKLRRGMKVGGKIIIVDFKKEKLNISAPPIEERYDASMLVLDLKAAGFHQVEINQDLLTYQYVVMALA